jgi:hypothetical protein
MNLPDELRRSLREGATGVPLTPDVVALGDALSAADRRRRRRTVAGVGLVAGLVLVGAVASATALDGDRGAVSTPPAGNSVLPAPEPTVPTTVPSTPPAEVAPEPEPAAEPAVNPAPAAAPRPAPLVGAQPSAPPVAPPAETVPSPPAETPASLTASAAYGSCAEDPPYDDYSGTAKPGATVTLTSPHSSPVSVTADESGHWSTRVYFPAAPVGTGFTVTASTPGAASVGMGFVRTA